jgi:putative ABC transport system permease protein
MRQLDRWLYTVPLRLRSLFQREKAEQDLQDELQFHIDQQTQRHMARGLSPDQAQRAARQEMNGVEAVKDACRDARGVQWVDDAIGDARYAARTLRRSPGFTAVAVLTLGLGIGVNVTVFTVTNAVLFKGFPSVVRNDRLLYIDSPRAGAGCCLSYPDFENWRKQATSFEDMAVLNGLNLTLSDQSVPETIQAAQVSVNAFRLLGQRPVIGRDFASSDATPGAPPVAILSYDLWERRYGKDPAIVGQTVKMGGIPAGSASVSGDPSAVGPTTIIGVMPKGFSFPFNGTAWVPLVPTPLLERREARSLWVAIGRMADGVTILSTRAELDTIGQRLASAYPLTNEGIIPRARSFDEFFGGSNVAMIYGSLWGAVGFVLLIACANLANLLLARATSRSREMSVRIALGAGRWRIIRQLLIESVMLSVTGGAVGGWMATWGLRAYALTQPSTIGFDYTMDYRALGYLITIAIGTGLLFGLAPASRLSKLDVNAALKDGGRGATGGRGRHLSALLVTGEMALAVVLLTGAGVMMRSFLKVYTADLGVSPANILTMYVALPAARYPGAEEQISFYDRLKLRLESIPGVESIAFSTASPTGGALTLPYELPGTAPVDSQRRPTLSALIISPGYFWTLGADVVSGREFTDRDAAPGIPALVVNQRFAARFWPGEDPLGKRLRLFNGGIENTWLTVVGVVPNIVQSDRTGQRMDPLIYLPYRQQQRRGMVAVARTRVPPEGLGPAFRREVQAMDADLPIGGPKTLAADLALNYRNNGFNGALFVMFAVIALLLASVGLYAVIAHSVGQRTQEIGIRTAMGATAQNILTLVFKQGMLPVGIGLTIGLVAALAVTPLLKTQLVGVSPADPLALVAASATLVAAAAVGCLIPARRAMRVDPVVALRHD